MMKLGTFFSLLAGVVTTWLTAWHYCAFFDGPTIILGTVFTAVVIIAGTGATAVLFDNDKELAAWLTALSVTLIVIGLPILSEYNANTDMIATIKAIGKGPVYLSEKASQTRLTPYPSGDPATQFMDKFLLTTRHPTTLVWNNVVKRANYLSYLYTYKYLNAGATVPHFGFVHANKQLSLDVRWTYHLGTKADYNSIRQKGKTVQYVDWVIGHVRKVVYGERSMYDHYSNRLKDINSVRKQPEMPLNTIRMITKVSKNSNSTALSEALNASLGTTLH